MAGRGGWGSFRVGQPGKRDVVLGTQMRSMRRSGKDRCAYAPRNTAGTIGLCQVSCGGRKNRSVRLTVSHGMQLRPRLDAYPPEGIVVRRSHPRADRPVLLALQQLRARPSRQIRRVIAPFHVWPDTIMGP